MILKIIDNVIPMIPHRIIENWILADKDCLKQKFHISTIPNYSNKTELLWGDKRDQDSNYPKCIVVRIRINNPKVLESYIDSLESPSVINAKHMTETITDPKEISRIMKLGIKHGDKK